RYSHTFDPVSGSPVLQDLAAVTVLHPSAALADGLSTVLLVKGSEQGWDYAMEHDLAALFVIREGDGFVSRSTPGFKALQQGEESSMLWLVTFAVMLLCVAGMAVGVMVVR